MPMLSFAFIGAAALLTLFSIYLSYRQAEYVKARREAVPADFAASVSLEDHKKAANYTIERERFGRFETLAGFALIVAWAAGGLNLVYFIIAGFTPHPLTRSVIFLVAVTAIGALFSLPFEVYKTFVLEQRYGFNHTTPATFTADRLKSWVISLIVAVPLLYAALWTMQTFSGLWWLWVWFGLLVLMAVAPAVFVRVIAPRFNTFTPLQDGPLKSRIESLLHRCGFRSSGLYSMDASRRTAHGNAYFIGFGNSKRIVLFDTLLAQSTPEEVEAVIAHELGHFHYRHVKYGLAMSAVINFAVLAAFGWLTKQDWLLPSFGIAYKDDGLALFVCSLLASVAGPLLAPLSNWISRRHEFQADEYARQNAGAGPMVSALTKLARDNASTLTPDPLYALVNYSHPPVPVRVEHLRKGEMKALQAEPAAA